MSSPIESFRSAHARSLASKQTYQRDQCTRQHGRALAITSPDGTTVTDCTIASTDGYQMFAARGPATSPREPFTVRHAAELRIPYKTFRAMLGPVAALSCDAGPKDKRPIVILINDTGLTVGYLGGDTWGKVTHAERPELADDTFRAWVTVDYKLIKRLPASIRGDIYIGITAAESKAPTLTIGAGDGSWAMVQAGFGDKVTAAELAYLQGFAESPIAEPIAA